MKKIPVIVFKNKSKVDRYLAANMDVGDWDDDALDVSINEIENAFMFWRKDLAKPNEEDIEQLKNDSRAYKKFMIEKFGNDALVSFDVERWLEYYEIVHLEVTREQYEYAREL